MEGREVKLGAFVVLASLAFAFLVLTFGDLPFLNPPSKEYVAYFKNVGGLTKGAEVRVAGIRAGKVKDISLVKDKVKVVFEISRDITIYADASASIGTLGLMGDKYLSVNPGSPDLEPLREGATLTSTRDIADTDTLIREMTRTARSFKRLASTMNQILRENRESLRVAINSLERLSETLSRFTEGNAETLSATLNNLQRLTEELNRTLPDTLASLDRLTTLLSSMAEENRGNVRVLVDNLATLTTALRDTLPELTYNVNELAKNVSLLFAENRENIRGVLTNLNYITDSLRRSTEKIDTIVSKIERGEGNLGKLVYDEKLYHDISKAARLLGQAGEVIDKTNIYAGFRGEVYEGGGSKGIFSLIVQPDKDKYYVVELVGDSRGRVYKEEFLNGEVSVKKEFKPEITVQYARNFFLFDRVLTLRGGLKESSGGIGLDLYPIPSTKLFLDLWEFGRRDRPSDRDLKPILQIGVSYKFHSPLYVRFGGDDILNQKLRGFFFGAGLLFTDNDLKYLIGGLGIPMP